MSLTVRQWQEEMYLVFFISAEVSNTVLFEELVIVLLCKLLLPEKDKSVKVLIYYE